MEAFYRYGAFCLCPRGGALPKGAVAVGAPFSPLVFTIRRNPMDTRGFYAIRRLSELDEAEGVGLLLPARAADETEGLARFVSENGASVLNTAFSRCFRVLEDYRGRCREVRRLNLVGLGNVGGTVAVGLKLLGTDIREIGVFDLDERQRARYEAELGQVLPVRDGERLPDVLSIAKPELFECDALLFTAARRVPDVGSEEKDVRMIQYAANRELLREYARMARESGFTGMFAQISDPVDQLSRAVFLMSNQDESGAYDWKGLLPEQVRGFGLGVMRARAIACNAREGVKSPELCVFGPHGKGLVVANAPGERYWDDYSEHLTKKTEEANLEIRKIGFKPYIAPGLSSACVSVLRAVRGEWHDAAAPIGGVYFGCRARFTPNGPELMRQPLHEELQRRIGESYERLKKFDAGWAD